MGNADVSAPVKQPWKHGLKLIKCTVCEDGKNIPYNCHKCNDMGEYWSAKVRTGVAFCEVGRLEESGLLKTLKAQELAGHLDIGLNLE